MSDCLFCKMVSGTIPVKKLHDDAQCIAIRDINPQAPTHLLVLPKKHIATMNDVAETDESLAGHLLRVGAQLAKSEGIAESGFRLVFNTNGDAGQTVFHIHLHVVGGRELGWPPG